MRKRVYSFARKQPKRCELLKTKKEMPELYTGRTRTLGTLLSMAQPPLQVPEWQRGYSWDSAAVERFWQELISLFERCQSSSDPDNDCLLGPVVLALKPGCTMILDGQHRLTTATILLSVVRDFLARQPGDFASVLQQRFIQGYNDATGTFAFKLTMSPVDRDFFRDEIQYGSGAVEPVVLTRSHQLIRNAKNLLRDRVEAQCARRKGVAALAWALSLQEILAGRVKFKTEVTLWSQAIRLPKTREDCPRLVVQTAQ